jgi:hypothetical protein
VVLATLFVVGGVIELVQGASGRDPSWRDVFANTLGAGIAVAWDVRRRLHWRRGATALLLLMMALAIAPLLWTLAAYAHRAWVAPQLWSPDSPLHMHFAAFTSGPYPGLTIDEPLRDWRRYGQLLVKVKNTGDRRAEVTISARDWGHGSTYADRYNEVFNVAAGQRVTLAVPLERIANAPKGRRLDLGQIDSVSVFQVAEARDPKVILLEVRLAP